MRNAHRRSRIKTPRGQIFSSIKAFVAFVAVRDMHKLSRRSHPAKQAAKVPDRHPGLLRDALRYAKCTLACKDAAAHDRRIPRREQDEDASKSLVPLVTRQHGSHAQTICGFWHHDPLSGISSVFLRELGVWYRVSSMYYDVSARPAALGNMRVDTQLCTRVGTEAVSKKKWRRIAARSPYLIDDARTELRFMLDETPEESTCIVLGEKAGLVAPAAWFEPLGTVARLPCFRLKQACQATFGYDQFDIFVCVGAHDVAGVPHSTMIYFDAVSGLYCVLDRGICGYKENSERIAYQARLVKCLGKNKEQC